MDVELLFYIRGDFEKFLHRYFDKYRESGEWFNLKGIEKRRLLNYY